jgi:Hypothetical glycosyl hydrolase family 15
MKIKLITGALVLGMVTSIFAARVPMSDIIARKTNKKAISLFQPWAPIAGGIIDTAGLHEYQKIAVHDLVHQGVNFYGLKWENLTAFEGYGDTFTPASILAGLAKRDSLLKLNPNLILIGEFRYYDADTGYLPDTSSWWLREGGKIVGSGYEKYQLLDFSKPAFQQHVAKQCLALVESGVVDGCLMDWAKNKNELIFRKVREIIGPDVLLMGNVNHNYDEIDQILPHLNGVYMESGWWGDRNTFPGYFRALRSTLLQAQSVLKEPKLICTEVWSNKATADLKGDSTHLEIDPSQEPLLRAGLTAHYTIASGYFSFYPQTFRDKYKQEHMHIYHDFMNAYLGNPTTTPATKVDSAYSKEWSNATVVFNAPGGKPYTVNFHELRKSQATKKVDSIHTVPPLDGDIFLKGAYTQIYPTIKPKPDTTYKSQVTGLNHGKSKTRNSLKFQRVTNSQKVIYKNIDAGTAPTYYDSKGQQIKNIQEPKK